MPWMLRELRGDLTRMLRLAQFNLECSTFSRLGMRIIQSTVTVMR